MDKRAILPPAAALAALLTACNELAPPPDDLSRRVKQKLETGQGSNAIPSSGHVEVAAAGGVVTLYGTVDAASEKEHAALIALGVEGVRSVVNNLVVVQGS